MTFVRLLAFVICCVPVAVFGADDDTRNGSVQFLDLQSFCKKYGCKKGPSKKDPPLHSSEWSPFESSSLLVWGADVCLGYFLTKHDSAWNGGSTVDSLDELYGVYLVLGDFEARVYLFDWPYNVEDFLQQDYSVFRCQNTRWPEQRLTDTEKLEVQRWIENRLSSENGWAGHLGDWKSPTVGKVVGKFRNEALELTVEIVNRNGIGTVKFYADYYGPPVSLGGPGSLY